MMQVYHIHELLWKAPTVFTEWTVIHWSNVGPDLGVGRGGRLGLRSGPRSQVGLRAAPILLWPSLPHATDKINI